MIVCSAEVINVKNILVGNGINIEFGGKDYCNSGIIRRLLSNLNTKNYSDMFANKVTNQELIQVIYGLHKELRNVLKGNYDCFCNSDEERFTLERIKQQYNFRTSMFDIGMEDYFFILKVYHNSFNDPQDLIKGTYDGICWLLLDAIFNNGNIQNIYENIKATKREKLRNIFSEFDNVFTVNYDCNVKKISDKHVYYLHGDFNTLLDQYNPDTLIGRMYLEKGEKNPVLNGNKHIYCNGIMGFTGTFKQNTMKIFENANLGIEQMMQRIEEGLTKEDEEKIENMKNSTDEKMQFAYDLIQTKLKFPKLSFQEYPSNKFKSISGELSIVGLSPNNDEHLWNMIRENHHLKKITYYYKSTDDKSAIADLYPSMNIVTVPVYELW